MKKDEFNREDLEFHLDDDGIKGLGKQYIMDAIFDKATQSMWRPQEGDIIVGCTGNVFVIGGKRDLHESLGGDLFFFNPSLVAIGGCFMDTPHTSTMNKDGRFLKPGKPEKGETYFDHCSWKEFRFVPYPHETSRMGEKLRTKLARAGEPTQSPPMP